jgi:hypothetical protein
MKPTTVIFLALLFTISTFGQSLFVQTPPTTDGGKTVGLNDVPVVFRLFQNTPNPFNPVTSIKFSLPENSDYSLKIYDMLGKIIYSFGTFGKSGTYNIEFDGSSLSSGIYFYSLETKDFREIRKMMLIK